MYEKSIENFSLISFTFLGSILPLYDRLFVLTLFCATLNQADEVQQIPFHFEHSPANRCRNVETKGVRTT